jgi:hypothetical protein
MKSFGETKHKPSSCIQKINLLKLKFCSGVRDC